MDWIKYLFHWLQRADIETNLVQRPAEPDNVVMLRPDYDFRSDDEQ